MNKKITMMLMFLSVFFMTNFELNAQTYNAANGVHYTQSQTDVNAGNATYAPGDFELIAGSMSTAFITEWVTNDGQVIIPTEGTGYNYDITWTNMTNPTIGDGSAIGATGNYMINGLTSGDTYEIAITGDFPRIYFNNSGDKDKIRKVTQWGDIEWTSMESAFAGAKYLEVTAMDVPNLSNVQSLSTMFHNVKELTGSLGNWNWNTENVTDMNRMFYATSYFNGDITSWNTENVVIMTHMFSGAVNFNQDISTWNTSNVTHMNHMFRYAHDFNQNLGNWDLSSLITAVGMFDGLSNFGIDCYNLGETLKGWRMNPNTPNNITLGCNNHEVPYLTDLLDVQYLHDNKNWNITGLTGACDTLDEASTFKTEWVTNNGSITIPTNGSGYHYFISWTNLTNPGIGEGSDIVQNGDYTFSGLSNGDTYEVMIVGDFPRIYFNSGGDKDKIKEVTQWGSNSWTSMNGAFAGTKYLEITAMDVPNLSNVIDMNNMFHNAKGITGNLGNWDWNTENVEYMNRLFYAASYFNGDITNWNIQEVKETVHMFSGAANFNQDIGSWNTSSISNMNHMFRYANAFNQNLGNWDLSSLYQAKGMFDDISELGIDCYNLSQTLEGWSLNPNTPDNITLGVLNKQVQLSTMNTAIQELDINKNWTIVGLDGACDKTEMSGFESLVEEAQLDISVYPNPTSGVFTLASEQGKDYVVMDIYGRTILQNKITDSKTVIDLSAYPRGMYYVQVGEQVARIVLK